MFITPRPSAPTALGAPSMVTSPSSPTIGSRGHVEFSGSLPPPFLSLVVGVGISSPRLSRLGLTNDRSGVIHCHHGML